MLRSGVRLAILDEPFRGLDREKRRELLSNARQHWQDTTLICVTHDVGETTGFQRVLVIQAGRIIEDDAPSVLLAQPDSRYRALLEAEKAVRKGLWAGVNWRRLWLADKRLAEKEN
jgi:ATP-binding cassette subfamily B protein